MLFDKIANVYFIRKTYLYFCIENRQPREPALCQLYRHAFVPIRRGHCGGETGTSGGFWLGGQYPLPPKAKKILKI